MADTSTPLGTLNMWHRSSDVTEECGMRWLLGRLYGRDADAGYFLNGTAVHGVAEDVLNGMTLAEAQEKWDAWMREQIAASPEVRWTRKRPADTAHAVFMELTEKWHESVIEASVNPFGEISLVATEFHTHARVGPLLRESQQILIHTQVDSVWRAGDDYIIIDFKKKGIHSRNCRNCISCFCGLRIN